MKIEKIFFSNEFFPDFAISESSDNKRNVYFRPPPAWIKVHVHFDPLELSQEREGACANRLHSPLFPYKQRKRNHSMAIKSVPIYDE